MAYFIFFKQKTAYDIQVWLEFRRVLFFFQAEDGIRDSSVTGVQTCALPISAVSKMTVEYGYRGAFYGHFGHGCVHMRVSFDLQSENGIRKYSEFIGRAADLVVGYGGSLSGEHGDGQSRAALLPKMFGSELMKAFGEFKAA